MNTPIQTTPERLNKAAPRLLAASVLFLRHACRPGDDGKYDDGYDDARAELRAAIADATDAPCTLNIISSEEAIAEQQAIVAELAAIPFGQPLDTAKLTVLVGRARELIGTVEVKGGA